MEEAKKNRAEKAEISKQSFFKGVRKEFDRVTWPTRADVIKQTIAVLVISVFCGVLISLLDMGFSTIVNALAGIG